MRLIDADKFNGKVIASHAGSGVIKLVAIDDVPTAYDPNKVVEQLEELANENGNVYLDCADVIEIVKSGIKK